MGSITFSTYNVLHPYPQFNNFTFLNNKGKDWSSRVDQIALNIFSSDSDVICLQEIGRDNFNDLQKNLNGIYKGFHTLHDGNHGQAKADGVAVLYKDCRFTNKKIKTCDKNALSSTPRRHLYVDLEDNITHRIIRCASGHIEGGPREPGDIQLTEMLNYIDTAYQDQAYQVDIMAVGVDLNEVSNGGRFLIFSNFGYATDGDRKESEINLNRKIDFVFSKACKPNLTINRQGGVYSDFPPASDHHMVSSTLRF